MGRPSNTEERQLQIVRALEQVMATHGYDKATVAAIADAAGLAPGLVHYHFANKLEILVALVEDLGTRLAARYQSALRPGADAHARLMAWLDAHVALGDGANPQAVACWVNIGAESIRQPEVQAVYVKALLAERHQLEALLVEAIAPKRVSASRRQHAAAALLVAIQGAYLLGTAAPGVAPKGFAREALRSLATRCLEELS